MQITTRKQNGIAILKLSGEVDLYNAFQISEELDRLAAEKYTKAVVDLEMVPYVDSTGIGAFLAGAKKMKAKGGDLKFCNVRDSVKKIFKLANLLPRFTLYPSEDEALAAFEG